MKKLLLLGIALYLVGSGTRAFAHNPKTKTEDDTTMVARQSLPPPPPGVLRISCKVMENMLEKTVDPAYPEDLIAANARGLVVLLATIDKTGEVSEVQVVFGPARFRDPAVEAVKQWRYRPYLVEGQAVVVQTTITLGFAPPRQKGVDLARLGNLGTGCDIRVLFRSRRIYAFTHERSRFARTDCVCSGCSPDGGRGGVLS